MSTDDTIKTESKTPEKTVVETLDVEEEKVIPPDSKFGWIVVFGSFLAHYVALGSMYTFGVFVLPLSSYFGTGRGAISWIGSITPGIALLFATFSGRLSDRFGFRTVVLIGSCLIAISFLISSTMPVFYALYFTHGIILGCGVSMTFIPSAGAAIQWFSRYQGIATGIAVSGSGVGNFVFPIVATALVEKHGWRVAYRLLSIFAILGIIASLFLKRRVPVRRKWNVLDVFKDSRFVLLYISGLFIGYGYLIPFVHISPFAEDKGISKVKAALLLSIIGGASTAGRIITGIGSDKFGKLLMLRICYGIMAISTFVWPFLNSFSTLAVYAFVYGFFGGGYISTLPTVAADYFGVERLASIIGVLYSSSAIGNMLGPPVAGFIFDANDSYLWACVMSALSLTIGFILTLFLPRTYAPHQLNISCLPFPPGFSILNPAPYYERYRRAEYANDAPFFQWWYFWVKDVKLNRNWAVAYQLVDSTESPNKGAYLMFSVVDNLNVNNLVKYEKYQLEEMKVENYFDLSLTSSNGQGIYELKSIDNNTFHIYGKMNNSANAWNFNNCSKNLFIEWNVTFHRIYGWFGQREFEPLDIIWGDIEWNTYSHASYVEGSITIGDEVISFSTSDPFRGYADMNWGFKFPSGPSNNSEAYNWGWFAAPLIPGENGENKEEISIIGGSGVVDVGFPFYSMLGEFLDVRIGDLYSLEVVVVGWWEESGFNQSFGLSSDGEVYNFDIVRSNWVPFHDQYGTEVIPLQQDLIIETASFTITLNFMSKLQNYNRLLFPYESYIFSDFEGLGVVVNVNVTHFNEDGKVDFSIVYTTESGGVEFGHK